MSGFQKQVNQYWAPGVEGSFASGNRPTNYVCGPGGLVSGASGLTVGRFAFASPQSDGSERADNSASLATAASLAPASVIMFIANEQQGNSTAYLSEAGMTILAGQAVEGFTRGDFWAKTSTAATRGQKVFASLTDGSVQTGAAGATVAGYVETKFSVLSTAAVGELVKIGFGD